MASRLTTLIYGQYVNESNFDSSYGDTLCFTSNSQYRWRFPTTGNSGADYEDHYYQPVVTYYNYDSFEDYFTDHSTSTQMGPSSSSCVPFWTVINSSDSSIHKSTAGLCQTLGYFLLNGSTSNSSKVCVRYPTTFNGYTTYLYHEGTYIKPEYTKGSYSYATLFELYDNTNYYESIYYPWNLNNFKTTTTTETNLEYLGYYKSQTTLEYNTWADRFAWTEGYNNKTQSTTYNDEYYICYNTAQTKYITPFQGSRSSIRTIPNIVQVQLVCGAQGSVSGNVPYGYAVGRLYPATSIDTITTTDEVTLSDEGGSFTVTVDGYDYGTSSYRRSASYIQSVAIDGLATYTSSTATTIPITVTSALTNTKFSSIVPLASINANATVKTALSLGVISSEYSGVDTTIFNSSYGYNSSDINTSFVKLSSNLAMAMTLSSSGILSTAATLDDYTLYRNYGSTTGITAIATGTVQINADLTKTPEITSVSGIFYPATRSAHTNDYFLCGTTLQDYLTLTIVVDQYYSGGSIFIYFGDSLVKTIAKSTGGTFTTTLGPFSSVPATEGIAGTINVYASDGKGLTSGTNVDASIATNSGTDVDTLTLYLYEPVSATFSGYRSNSSGTASDTGTYAYVTGIISNAFVPTTSDTYKITLGRKAFTSSSWTSTVQLSAGSTIPYTFNRAYGTISTTTGTTIRMVVTDCLGIDYTWRFDIASPTAILQVYQGGTGIGLGTQAVNNALTVGWDATFYGDVVIQGSLTTNAGSSDDDGTSSSSLRSYFTTTYCTGYIDWDDSSKSSGILHSYTKNCGVPCDATVTSTYQCNGSMSLSLLYDRSICTISQCYAFHGSMSSFQFSASAVVRGYMGGMEYGEGSYVIASSSSSPTTATFVYYGKDYTAAASTMYWYGEMIAQVTA